MTVVGKMAKKSKKVKQMPDENAPLLPTKRQDESGFDEFDGASFSGAVFNLSTTIVGAGIMALPATMKVLGLGLGMFMIVFMALLSERSIDMLLKFSRAGKSTSYGAVMEDAFGKVGRVLVQLAVLVNNIGVLIVYMIIIGDVLSGTSSSGMHHAGVLEGWFGSQWWNGRLMVLMITTLCVFAPLACFKRIDHFGPTLDLTLLLKMGLDKNEKVTEINPSASKDDRKKGMHELIDPAFKSFDLDAVRNAIRGKAPVSKRPSRAAPKIHKQPSPDDDAEVQILSDPIITPNQPPAAAQKRKQPSTTAPKAGKGREVADMPPKRTRTDKQTAPSNPNEPPRIEPNVRDVRTTPTSDVPPFLQPRGGDSVIQDEDQDLFLDNPEIIPLKMRGVIKEVCVRIGRVLRYAYLWDAKANKLKERVKELKGLAAEKDKAIAASAPRIKQLEGQLVASEKLSGNRMKACEAEIRNRELIQKRYNTELPPLQSKLDAANKKIVVLTAKNELMMQRIAEREAHIDKLENVIIPEMCAEFRLKGEEGVKTIIEELFPDGTESPFPWAELEKRETERDAAEQDASSKTSGSPTGDGGDQQPQA